VDEEVSEEEEVEGTKGEEEVRDFPLRYWQG